MPFNTSVSMKVVKDGETYFDAPVGDLCTVSLSFISLLFVVYVRRFVCDFLVIVLNSLSLLLPLQHLNLKR